MIRKAHFSDKYQVVRLCELFWKESRYSLPFDKGSIEELYDQVIQNEDAILLVSEENNKITGILAACLSRTLFSPTPIAIELAWFIKEEYRGRSDAIRLMKTYEEWARFKGCHSVCMADLTQTNDLEKFYTRMGYSPVEQSYIKEL